MIRFDGVEIDRANKIVRHAGKEMRFRRQESWKLVCALLLSNGLTAEELFEHIYGDREDGGPIRHYKQIQKMLCLLREKAGSAHLRVHKFKTTGKTRYILVPTKGETE